MSTPLRDAVIERLRSLGEPGANGAVLRVSVDVEADGRIETVLVGLRDSELRCVSTDGRDEGPHVRAALRFIAASETLRESLGSTISSTPPRADEAPSFHELADALDDLMTAITRVGIRGAQFAPSVDSALERIIEVAPKPTPPALDRFLGRLQQALRAQNPKQAARLLDGACQLIETLRGELQAVESDLRIAAWLGVRSRSCPRPDLLSDRTMIEVGREWLSGTERASIERRYLVDLRTGVVCREDRPRNALASLGPCPRELRVGLAEVEPGPEPRRVRVLQYEVQPRVRPETWEQLEHVASRSFAELTTAYQCALRTDPALCEPFAVIRPYRIEGNGVFRAFDAEGHQLVLDRSQRRGAVLAFYDLLTEGIEPTWLAGRLTDTGGTLCLVPFAMGAHDRRYVRL